MEYRKYGNIYALRVDRGGEVMQALTELAERENIRAAKIEGLGAADYLSVGLYDVEKPLEITSLIGSMTRMDKKPYLHVHINAADADNRAIGGHLNAVRISGTAELFVTVLDGEIGRKKDPAGTGLNIFDFGERKEK